MVNGDCDQSPGLENRTIASLTPGRYFDFDLKGNILRLLNLALPGLHEDLQSEKEELGNQVPGLNQCGRR